MDFLDAVTSGFRRWADYKTRSSRSEFWWCVLFTYVLSFAFMFVFFIAAIVTGSIAAALGGNETSAIYRFYGFMAAIVLLFAIELIPLISLTVRRLHDIGRSGWWLSVFAVFLWGLPMVATFYLAAAVFVAYGDTSSDANGLFDPFPTGALLIGYAAWTGQIIAMIWFIIWMVRPGQDQENLWGPNPLRNMRSNRPPPVPLPR